MWQFRFAFLRRWLLLKELQCLLWSGPSGVCNVFNVCPLSIGVLSIPKEELDCDQSGKWCKWMGRYNWKDSNTPRMKRSKFHVTPDKNVSRLSNWYCKGKITFAELTLTAYQELATAKQLSGEAEPAYNLFIVSGFWIAQVCCYRLSVG